MTQKRCEICGRIEDEHHKIKFCSNANKYLCGKHKSQFYRFGRFLDNEQRTTADKNEYIIHNKYAEILIRNKNQELIATTIIDIEDIEKCKKIKWGLKPEGYVCAKHKKVSLHRYILNYSGDLQVDHINRDKLDNRKNNLRIVSVFINNQNNGADGVFLDKKTNKWKAEFNRYGKYFYAGEYKTKEEAIKARIEKIKEVDKNKETLLLEYKNKDIEHFIGIKPSPHGKWIARFCAEGQTYHVGTFDTKEEAIIAREIAINKYHKIKESA